MTICNECATDNPAAARYCFGCGSALISACTECGAELPTSTAAFCPSCGARQRKEESEDKHMLKLATILFADVVGSTSRSEQMLPEEIRELMVDFFDAMTQEIRAEGGRLEKFIGDAIMAVFGVPHAHEDDPVRAVRAGRRMLARLARWNEGRDPLHQIQIRIGINTGNVLAAAPGHDMMVTGDAVNVAARFEQYAQKGTIVLGARTAAAARRFFLLDSLPPLELKGKAEPVPAFQVREERDIAQERGIPGLVTPLVGRDLELDTLKDLLARVELDNETHLVALSADPGVGKSRLVAEFTARASGRVRIVVGRCLPYGEGVTLWPLVEILEAEAGVLHTDPADEALEKVTKLVDQAIPSDLEHDYDRTVAGLASTIGLADRTDAFKDLGPRERFKELLAAWRTLLSALAREQPLIAVIEDIHWADPTVLNALADFVTNLHAPLLLVCPTRPEVFTTHGEWAAGLDRFTRLEISPLDKEQSEFLFSELLGEADLPPTVQERILRSAEGNPFYLEEIVQRLMNDDLLVERDGRWKALPGIEEIDIPDSVHGVILARIDLLPDLHKQVVRSASVLGRAFWDGAVRYLLPTEDSDSIDEALSDLMDRKLVFRSPTSSMEGEAEFTFKHILTRDVAYETLPRKRRARSHVAAAEWIKREAGERFEELSEVLGHHYHQAFTYSKDDDHRQRARTLYSVAARKACERFATQQAETLGWLTVDLSSNPSERVESLEKLGDQFCMTFNMDGAWKVFNDAIEEATTELDDKPAVGRIAAKAAILPTRWFTPFQSPPSKGEVEEMIQRGHEALGQQQSPSTALLLASRAFMETSGYARDREEGFDAAMTALDMAERLDDPDLVSTAVDAVVSFFFDEGRYDEIYEANRRRTQLLSRITDVKEACDAMIVSGWSAWFTGRYIEAVHWATECLERARGIDLGSFSLGLVDRVRYRFVTGDWDGALEDQKLLESLNQDDVEAEGIPPRHTWSAYAFTQLCLQLRGQIDEAARYASLLDTFDEHDRTTGRFAPTIRSAAAARALLEAGDLDGALAKISLEPSPVVVCHLEPMCEYIGLSESWDRLDEIVSAARAESERAGARTLPYFIARLEGRAALAAGDAPRATELLRTSATGFGELAAAWEEATSRALLAHALDASEEHDAAATEREVASSIQRSLGIGAVGSSDSHP